MAEISPVFRLMTGVAWFCSAPATRGRADYLRRYSTSRDVPALKALASGMVTAHLNMAKGLKP
ncbi:hypothetical protein CJD35_22190 (plasmid) [Sphingobium xenophagum]|uniref:Uncharacterized protein n=1 Tax=Sphingobium xenophagum TaxID=121428 RepID=A0A249N185_SPHXE|nr:hypothetical protein CJD35_22190 [Sphingobium xenophagum]